MQLPINHVTSNTSFYQNNFTQESLFKIQSDVIRKVASQGACVFVGRCADYVLRDFPNVVNVFVTASMDDRVQLFMKEKNVSREEAIRRIEQVEHRRATYYNYYTGKKWGQASSYDLCIDSSLLGIAETGRFIADFIRRRLAHSDFKQ